MVVGVGVTITDPGARVDSCTPGVKSHVEHMHWSGM